MKGNGLGKEKRFEVAVLSEVTNTTANTNPGCKSYFARFDNRVRVSGGSVSITVTHKNVIRTNGLLVDSVFEDKCEGGRKSRWKWARCSGAVNKVLKLEADFE